MHTRDASARDERFLERPICSDAVYCRWFLADGSKMTGEGNGVNKNCRHIIGFGSVWFSVAWLGLAWFGLARRMKGWGDSRGEAITTTNCLSHVKGESKLTPWW